MEEEKDVIEQVVPEAPKEIAMVGAALPRKTVCSHPNCTMSSLKGARNGFFYGSRLRFAHAFVMSILFGKKSFKENFDWAVKMAISHGQLLATYVFCYKTAQCILQRLLQRQVPWISFLAGSLGS